VTWVEELAAQWGVTPGNSFGQAFLVTTIGYAGNVRHSMRLNVRQARSGHAGGPPAGLPACRRFAGHALTEK
jgi:hypothetical protein